MTDDLYISATQFDSFSNPEHGCQRRWWFQQVAKLPRIQKDSAHRGAVLHSVIERYLKADNNGLDAQTGLPVELYPPGWHTVTERGRSHTLSIGEQGMLRSLVTKAIESGIIVKYPNIRVEQPMKRRLDGLPVIVVGKKDIVFDEGIEDTKTSKSRRWAKSPKKLHLDSQILLYSHDWFQERADKGAAIPETIQVAHNFFCFDPDDLLVKKIRPVTPVTLSAAAAFWEGPLRQTAEKMLELRKVTDWTKTPDPTTRQACSAFGGCPYAPICTLRESPEMYRSRLDRVSAAPVTYEPVLTKRTCTMSFRDKIAQAKAGASAAPAPAAKAAPAPTAKAPAAAAPAKKLIPAKPAPAAIVAPAPKPQAPAAKPQAPAPAAAAPSMTFLQVDVPFPWGHEGCTLCGGSGLKPNGQPCRLCGGKSGYSDVLKAFNIQAIEGGWVWSSVSGDADGVVMLVNAPQAEETAATEAEASAQPAEEAQAEGPTEEAALAEEAQTDEPSSAVGGRGRGRPRATFRILIGVRSVKGGPGRVTPWSDVMKDFGARAATEFGVPSYHHIDAFKRRDWMSQNAAAIGEALTGRTLDVSTLEARTPDAAAILAALIPLADTVLMSATEA